MERVCIFLANGFETIEALTPIDYLRRAGGEKSAILVSTTGDLNVTSAQGVVVKADALIDELDAETLTAAIIPGGLPGATNLRDNEQVINLVKILYDDEKLIAAICAGPIVLEKAGILSGKNATSYPGFEEEMASAKYQNDRVVVDENIITARGPAIATDFALEIVKKIYGKKKFEEIKSDILYDM